MSTMKILGFFALVGVVLAGCAAPYNTNFPLVDKGMSFSQVTDLIGKPISAESGPEDTKILYYRMASSPLDTDGSDTREYWVQVAEGKVIGYGERNDQMTLMRDARQFAAAWNSAKIVNDSAMRMQPTKIEVDVK
jgi:hypothetical protein